MACGNGDREVSPLDLLRKLSSKKHICFFSIMLEVTRSTRQQCSTGQRGVAYCYVTLPIVRVTKGCGTAFRNDPSTALGAGWKISWAASRNDGGYDDWGSFQKIASSCLVAMTVDKLIEVHSMRSPLSWGNEKTTTLYSRVVVLQFKLFLTVLLQHLIRTRGRLAFFDAVEL